MNLTKRNHAPRIDAHGQTVGTSRHIDPFVVAQVQRSLHIESSHDRSLEDSRLDAQKSAQVLFVADSAAPQPTADHQKQEATRVAVERILDQIPFRPTLDLDGEAALRRALAETVKSASSGGGANPRESVPTDVSLSYIRWPKLFVANCGQNRVVLLRGREVRDLTGPDAKSLVDDVLEPGDALFLMTRTLAEIVDDQDLIDAASVEQSAEAMCGRLAVIARAHGLSEGTSVACARVPEHAAIFADLLPEPAALDASAHADPLEKRRSTSRYGAPDHVLEPRRRRDERRKLRAPEAHAATASSA